MKKATTLIILLALLFSLNIPINAEELKPTCIKDDKIAELLTNSLPEDLTDTDVYSITIDGINVTDKPILKVFNYDSFRMAHLPLEDIIPNMSKETNINQKSLDYVIFDIIPRRVSAIKDIRTEDPDDYAIYRSDYCKDPPYVTDIINMELKTEILNVACEIKDMIAFDGFHSHMGAMLYVTTDKGVFVKYYTDEISEGTWFTEEDFQKFGKAYYEYLVEI